MSELKLAVIVILCCLLGISVLWFDDLSQLLRSSDQQDAEIQDTRTNLQQDSAQAKQCRVATT
jgi:hypothetical protein